MLRKLLVAAAVLALGFAFAPNADAAGKGMKTARLKVSSDQIKRRATIGDATRARLSAGERRVHGPAGE